MPSTQGIIASSKYQYQIGDTGPAGGIIFITPSTSGNSTGLWFEAAPTTWYSGTQDAPDIYYWRCSGTNVTNGATAIGTGKTNTEAFMTNGCGVSATDSGLYIASTLVLNGYDDWFIPSEDELNEMYINKTALGISSSGIRIYWSSTDTVFDISNPYRTARNQAFAGAVPGFKGDSSKNFKGGTYYWRPCRSFAGKKI